MPTSCCSGSMHAAENGKGPVHILARGFPMREVLETGVMWWAQSSLTTSHKGFVLCVESSPACISSTAVEEAGGSAPQVPGAHANMSPVPNQEAMLGGGRRTHGSARTIRCGPLTTIRTMELPGTQ